MGGVLDALGKRFKNDTHEELRISLAKNAFVCRIFAHTTDMEPGPASHALHGTFGPHWPFTPDTPGPRGNGGGRWVRKLGGRRMRDDRRSNRLDH